MKPTETTENTFRFETKPSNNEFDFDALRVVEGFYSPNVVNNIHSNFLSDVSSSFN